MVTGNFQSASKFTTSISKKAIFQSKQPRARNLFAVVGDDTFEGDKSGLSEIRADKAKRDLDRIIKASTIAPKLTQTLHEVVQVSRISLLELNYAITAAGRLGRVDDAVRVFENVQTLGYTPELRTYNNIIWAVGHCGRVDLALHYYQELLQSTNLNASAATNGLPSPNVYTYSAVMHAFAKSHNYKEALAFLDDLMCKGKKLNLIVFGAAMDACASIGKYKEALLVLKRAEESGFTADSTLLNTAIKACLVANATMEVNKLFNQVRDNGQADVFTYHLVMSSHFRAGRLRQVLDIFDDAIHSGRVLDAGLFAIAISAAFQLKQYPLLLRLANHADASRIILTDMAYTQVMETYIVLGTPENALACFEEMKAKGIHPTVFAYAVAVDACRHDPVRALSLIQEAKRENIEVNTVLLSTLLNVLMRHGNPYIEQCMNILYHMEGSGPEPNLYTYNVILRGLSETKTFADGLELIEGHMIPRGITPDVVSFTSLLQTAGRSATCRDSTADQVDKVFSLMEQYQIKPDDIVFGAALDAFRRSKNVDGAIRILQYMKERQFPPTVSHLNLVMLTLKAAGDIDRLFAFAMQIVKKDKMKMNANTFEIVLETLVAESRWQDALALLQEMIRQQFHPSSISCTNLIHLLAQHEQHRAALVLYQYMLEERYDLSDHPQLQELFPRLLHIVAANAKKQNTTRDGTEMFQLTTSVEQEAIDGYCIPTNSSDHLP